MVAKYSQEREKQIKELCEGTIYSFVGWDGEYSGKDSKFICECKNHGYWCVAIYNFISHGTRCRKCKSEENLIPAEKVIVEIEKACVGTTYSFVRWDGEYKGCKKKFVCKCEKHGEWKPIVDNFLRGSKCPSCSGVKKYSQGEREKQIEQLCKDSIYAFVGWEDYYKNTNSRIICNCEKHGNWSVTVNEFINRNSKCNQCKYEKDSLRRRIPQSQREQQIKKLCEGTNYRFIAWVKDYKNSFSKFTCDCDKHGIWELNINDFLNGKRCPSCAPIGYRPAKTGTLYCLRSECGQFVKIGISNQPKQRFTQLKRKTPFDFHVIELFTHEDGRKAQKWENIFHKSFESANLTGFDGCTEWLKWNPQIPLWFRFLT